MTKHEIAPALDYVLSLAILFYVSRLQHIQVEEGS